MRQHAGILHTAQVLIFLNALIWIGVGVANLILFPGQNVPPFWRLAIVAGFMIYGLVLGAAGLAVGRWQGRTAWGVAFGLMLLTILLFLFDDFGLADLLSMLPALVTAVYLFIYRRQLSTPQLAV